MSNRPTIHDIAKALGIDSSTVSRALNDSPRVSEKTRSRVLEKSEEMGYKPNLLASNLRKKVTNTIGVVVPRISRHFFSSAIQGIEEIAYNNGYNVIICQSLEQLEREKKIIETLVANRVDGVLVSVSMETTNYNHLEILKQSDIPLVFFDRHCPIEGYSNVLIDDFQGGYDATCHLIANGCENIIHFSGPQALEIYKSRFEGYKAALKEHNIPFNKDYVLSSKLMEADGYNHIKTFLKIGIPVDAIFSANDLAAVGAMKYIKEQNISIPNEIAIVGFSNEPISKVIEPSLTTIEQSGFKIGTIAIDLLLKHITNKNTLNKEQTIRLESNLIERNSSKKINT